MKGALIVLAAILCGCVAAALLVTVNPVWLIGIGFFALLFGILILAVFNIGTEYDDSVG